MLLQFTVVGAVANCPGVLLYLFFSPSNDSLSVKNGATSTSTRERAEGDNIETTDGGDEATTTAEEEVKNVQKMEISETISRMKDEMLTKAL